MCTGGRQHKAQKENGLVLPPVPTSTKTLDPFYEDPWKICPSSPACGFMVSQGAVYHSSLQDEYDACVVTFE